MLPTRASRALLLASCCAALLLASCCAAAAGSAVLPAALDLDDSCAAAGGWTDCALSAVQRLRSLGTGSATALSAAEPAAPAGVTWITVETREDAPPLVELNNFTGRTGVKVEVLGVGTEWEGWQTKLSLISGFVADLRERLGPNRSARELVVFMDATDVLWGGCDLEAEFLAAYREISARGAPIVFNADTCGNFAWPEAMRLRAPETPVPELYLPYRPSCSVRRDGAWHSQCTLEDLGHLDKPAGPQRPGGWCGRDLDDLNAGFFVGPVDKVDDMVKWALLRLGRYENDDQKALTAYWLQHRHIVTLDYRGELGLCLGAMGYNALTVDADRGAVQNEALGRPQCFLHGANIGKYRLLLLLHQLGIGGFGPERLGLDVGAGAWLQLQGLLRIAVKVMSSPPEGSSNAIPFLNRYWAIVHQEGPE